MPKSRKKKKKKRAIQTRPLESKSPESLEGSFFMFVWGVIGTTLGALSVYLYSFVLLREEVLRAIPPWLLETERATGVTCLMIALGLFANVVRRRNGRWIFVPQTKKRAVLIVFLFFFNLSVIGILILYARGYISRLAAFLPGKEQLGNKLSLGLAFALAAIFSGVLGNFAYDVLKFLIRKRMNKSL
jgi:hypothetical protein